jgi:hypothetical protein
MAAQMNWLKSTAAWGKEVAEHPCTSRDTLMELAGHADVEVRTAVADHRNTPLDTVLKLAQDESADLRYAIAENHNVHADVLSILARDENPFIAHRAMKTLERLRSPLIVMFPIVALEPLLQRKQLQRF